MPHNHIPSAIAFWKTIGGASIGGATLAQIDPELMGEASQMPLTIALILLSGFSVWMAFRMAEKSRLTADKQADNLGKMAEKIGELCAKIHNVVYIKEGNRKDDLEVGHVE